MDYSFNKLDPTKMLLQEIEVQETTAQNFFVYLGHFKERLEFFDLEHQSPRIMDYLEQLVETRNKVWDDYENLKNDLKDDGISVIQKKIITEKKHDEIQKQVMNVMEEQIEELTFAPIPKDLPKETKDDINQLRAKVIKSCSRIKQAYYGNGLGQGGEGVLI